MTDKRWEAKILREIERRERSDRKKLEELQKQAMTDTWLIVGGFLALGALVIYEIFFKG